MNRIHVLPLLALPLALSACGGGGGVASTPAPSASYQTLDQLTGNQTFQSAGYHYNSNGVDRGTDSFGTGLTFAYNAASDTFTITTPTGLSATFDPSHFQPAQSTASARVFVKGSPSTTQVLVLNRPAIGGVPLSYAEVASFFDVNTTTGWVAVGGVPTRSSDMPRSGSASYTAATVATITANGQPYTVNASTGSTATFSANFGANSVSTSVHLAGSPNGGGPVVDFGTVSGTGTISSTGPGFTGTFAGTSGPGFSGAFFGPQGVEAAYGYNFISGYSGGSYEAFGVTVAKKN